MEILKGFKIVFTSENNSVSSEHDASDCDKSNSVKITLHRHKLNRKMSWRAIMSYYILSSNKLPLQVMNSFVWKPLEKPARCLWDHCHSFEIQCEPCLHHTRCHGSGTSPCVRAADPAWQHQPEGEVWAFSSAREVACKSPSLHFPSNSFQSWSHSHAETLQHWEERQGKGSAPQLPALAGFVHAAVFAGFLPAPVIQIKWWGW